jgi:hypothetical protein
MNEPKGERMIIALSHPSPCISTSAYVDSVLDKDAIPFLYIYIILQKWGNMNILLRCILGSASIALRPDLIIKQLGKRIRLQRVLRLLHHVSPRSDLIDCALEVALVAVSLTLPFAREIQILARNTLHRLYTIAMSLGSFFSKEQFLVSNLQSN